MAKPEAALRKLPSVDEVMRSAGGAVAHFGRPAVVDVIRTVLAEARAARSVMSVSDVTADAVTRLDALAQPNLRPVFNLTGTVLHTNLGRALIAEEAVKAAVAAM